MVSRVTNSTLGGAGTCGSAATADKFAANTTSMSMGTMRIAALSCHVRARNAAHRAARTASRASVIVIGSDTFGSVLETHG